MIHRRGALGAAAGLLALGAMGREALAQKPQSFMIFFDARQSELTPLAKQLAAAVASSVKPKSRVTIEGHCDTAEAEPDKLALSRAIAVLKELANAGVPAGALLTVVAKGTRSPMVKTGAKTAEPQNRRVSILIA